MNLKRGQELQAVQLMTKVTSAFVFTGKAINTLETVVGKMDIQ